MVCAGVFTTLHLLIQLKISTHFQQCRRTCNAGGAHHHAQTYLVISFIWHEHRLRLSTAVYVDRRFMNAYIISAKHNKWHSYGWKTFWCRLELRKMLLLIAFIVTWRCAPRPFLSRSIKFRFMPSYVLHSFFRLWINILTSFKLILAYFSIY